MTLLEFRAQAARREADFVRRALARNEWSLSKAANELAINPSTLRAMIKTFGLSTEYQRNNPGRGRPKK